MVLCRRGLYRFIAEKAVAVWLTGEAGVEIDEKSLREMLPTAFEESDHLRRRERVDRVEWLLRCCNAPASMMGRTETLQLIEEARATFVDGYFVAALILAMAFVEHALVEDLQIRGKVKRSPKFSEALRLAEEHRLFPPDWLKRAKRLSLRRNPYAHLQKDGNAHGFGQRIFDTQTHPRVIMESDAKDAIELMYGFLTVTLREIDFEQFDCSNYQ